MKRRSLGEVCKLLGLRPHVVRYWEQVVPLFEPEKNVGGRRSYGERDIHLLYRLKHLIQERKFTVEGAYQTLLRESSGVNANFKARAQILRGTLLDLQEKLDIGKSRDLPGGKDFFSPAIPGQEHLERILPILPLPKRIAFVRERRKLSTHAIKLVQELRGSATEEKPIRAVILEKKVPEGQEERVPPVFEELFSRAALALVTSLKPGVSHSNPFLRAIASQIRQIAHQYGRMVPWFLLGGEDQNEGLRKQFARDYYFGLDPREIVFVNLPPFPYLLEGRVVILESGAPGTYPSGVGGGILLLKSPSFQKHFLRRGIHWLYVLPLNSCALPFPHGGLLREAASRNLSVSGTVVKKGGEFRTTGVYLMSRAFLEASPLPFGVREERLRIINPSGSSADDCREVQLERLETGWYRLLEHLSLPYLLEQ